MKQIDVAIIGGGPAGSTAATLLRKYAPDLRVVIIEKERFPRDHVGESQLPSIGSILDEMGVWEKIEAANFPIKIGASYTWGRSGDRWEFNFFPPEDWSDDPRPAKFEGQRRHTAFQVDRAIYDEILLRHAESLGVEVREGVAVTAVRHDDDRVAGLDLDDGTTIEARHYVDASGVVGILRRALGVETEVTEGLRNIAVWDYWQNARWAIEIGTGVTRVQVRSLPYGWIWFIPLGPTRTSIGLIMPSSHWQSLDAPIEEVYLAAIREQPDIAVLMPDAEREGRLQTCKDWSQLSTRLVGPNWIMAGEVCGFADPILAAGMSLAHSSARDAAYTILELDRGEHDPEWLRRRYDERHRTNIGQHIRFAQYWYAANGCFTDLQEHCREIARDAGLRLSRESAWRWLSQGGFATEQLGLPTFGSFDVATSRQLIDLFDSGDSSRPEYRLNGYNEFSLNLKGATETVAAHLADGRITTIKCWERGGRRLPYTGYYRVMTDAMSQSSDIHVILESIRRTLRGQNPSAPGATIDLRVSHCLQALDVMIEELWVRRKLNRKKPAIHLTHEGSRFIRWEKDGLEILEQGAKAPFRSNLE